MYEEYIQFHIWPWSATGRAQETATLDAREALLPYHGSPVLSIPQEFTVGTDARHEDFLPLGCAYAQGEKRYRLYRVPHAIAASRHTGGKDSPLNLLVSHQGTRRRMFIRSKGAVPGSLRDEGQLQRAVLEWMSFFDFCLQRTNTGETEAASIRWADLPELIQEYSRNPAVQRRSLIVTIAETMPQHVQQLVNAARRILIHERRLLPATQASELDSGCLQWYFRQPGRTTLEKASANRQRLQAMSRRETFNTLENRLVREFLLRCVRECRQYVRFVCAGETGTGCARDVHRFGVMCTELLKHPVWEDVEELESGARPNYVLQSDVRYRKIWELYQKLLRKQDDEDWMWAWQGRTWADICTLLICSALQIMEQQQKGPIQVSSLARSDCRFLKEQVQGSRMVTGSEPGPFLLAYGEREAVLEIVHARLAEKHNIVASLGCTGGSLFFILKPLGSRKATPRAIVIWPVHTLSSVLPHDFQTILASAEQGLAQQNQSINVRYSVVRLTGLVLADAFWQGEPVINRGQSIHLARLAADPCLWTKNINLLVMLLHSLFIETLENDDV